MAEMVSQAGPERLLAADRAGGNACTRPHQRAAPGQIPPAHKELPILLKGVQLPLEVMLAVILHRLWSIIKGRLLLYCGMNALLAELICTG